MADQKLTELTRLRNPSSAVRLYGVEDPGGTPAEYAIALAQLLGPQIPQMRLTLEQGVPISTSDQVGKSTLYWCPYNGNAVWLYDGTLWRRFEMPEIALQLSGLTSGKGYDTFVFPSSLVPSATDTGADTVDFSAAPGWATGSVCWVSETGGGLVEDTAYFLRAVDTDTYSLHSTLAGALANTGKVDITDTITATIIAVSLELSAAWASDTSRTDALTTQDGFYVKSGSTSRLHLGGFYTTGTTTTEDSEKNRYLDNRYNRRFKILSQYDTTPSWTYTTAAWRQANNSSSNQVELFDTTGTQVLFAKNSVRSLNTSAGVNMACALGLDTTSGPTGSVGEYHCGDANDPQRYEAALFCVPGLGRHYIAALEYSVNAGTTTFYGNSAVQGLRALWRC